MGLATSLTIYVPETPAIMSSEAKKMLTQVIDKGGVTSVKTVPDAIYERMIGKGPWPTGY